MKLERKTTCQLQGIDDTWDVDELDYKNELMDAVETVRDDHDAEVVVETDTIWIHRVYWNDNTDSVWVGTFGYHGGFELQDQDGQPVAAQGATDE